VTDINTQNSLLMVKGDAELIERITYSQVEKDEIFDLPGIVSRKKQLIPYLTSLCGTRHRAEHRGVQPHERDVPAPASVRGLALPSFASSGLTPGNSEGDLSAADFLDLRSAESGFGEFASSWDESASLSEKGGTTELQRSVRVSPNYFEVLRLRMPRSGRTLTATDEAQGSPRVVVISHDLWKSRYAQALPTPSDRRCPCRRR
jgi:hypothetical protein